VARQVAVPLELEEVKIQRPPLGRRLFNLARQHPLGLFGLLTVALLFFAAIFADLIVPYDPQAIDRDALLAGPSSSHLLGTDRLGRDVLSRTIFGARISLFIGLVSVVFGVTIGAALGIISGYLGRFVDSVIQRSVDILLAFPAIVLLLAVTAAAYVNSFQGQFLLINLLPEGFCLLKKDPAFLIHLFKIAKSSAFQS